MFARAPVITGVFLLNRGTRRIGFQRGGDAPTWRSWQEVEYLEIIIRDAGALFSTHEVAAFTVKLRSGEEWFVCAGPVADVISVRALFIDAMKLDPSSEQRIEPEFHPVNSEPAWPVPTPGEYRVKWRQRRVWLGAHVLVWLGWIPSMAGLHALFGQIAAPFMLAYMTLFIISGLGVATWPCPRCHNAFGWKGLQTRRFTSTCLHCGLRANT